MTTELKTGFIGALGIHVFILLSFTSLYVPDRFNVQAAPSSLEVALVSVKSQPKAIPEKQQVKEEQNNDLKIKKEIEKNIEEARKMEKQENLNSSSNHISGAVTEAQVKDHYNKTPVYPRLAREKGYEGKVLVKVFITKEGLVQKAEILRSSGHEMLDRSALNSIKKWQFQPAQQFGLPVKSTIEIPFVFRLNEV